MNTSQFMDKQIMDLSNSKSKNDFIDLMDPDDDHLGSATKEDIVPSYDFLPIRPIGASQQPILDSVVGGARLWNSADSKTNTTGLGIRNYSSLDSMEPSKVDVEKDHNATYTALVYEIEQAMKKHADNLMHALGGVSARISQLESRTRHLEHSMDDLKVSVGNNYGSTDGKLRQLENIIQEVHDGVQVIKDKQDIVESQRQLAKLQVSKIEQHSETQNTGHSDSLQQAASAPQQSHQQLPPVIFQPPHSLSLPNAPPPASQQILPTPVQLPNQFPPNQIPSVPQREPYFPPSQTHDATNQQYHQLPPQQQLPPPPVQAQPQQQYQPPPPPQYSQPPPPQQYSQPPPLPPEQYSQPPPPPQQYSQPPPPPPPPPPQHPSLSAVNPPQPQPQPQPSFGHHLEESTYAPQQNYPPSLSQPPYPPPRGNPPSQQFYGAPPQAYEPPSNRPNSGYSTSYGPSSGANDQYPYSGSASPYGSGSMKQPQLSSAAAQGSGSSYTQLPTARILPQALPTASAVSGGSGSAGTGNRAPIDEVVDKVTNMGFPRDQVRATVRKLTENGQSVDLNVVLDKLMNDGEGQPQRLWFGR